MRLATGLAVCVALCVLPRVAQAQNAVTGESIDVHATFSNVGVAVTISGDDDSDASAALEVNVDGGGFTAAHPLSRVAADRFVGSAFFLPEDTAYEVRVTLSDPDGVNGGTLTASGTTRSSVVPEPTGNEVHVDASAAAGGTGTASDPFDTVAAGLAVAQPGDVVLVHAGVYHEEVTVSRGGSPGLPITLAAAGDGPAILDGADPGLKDPAAWTDEGGHVYSAPVAQTRYVSVDGVRLWRYENLTDLQSLSLGTAGGFYFDGATVYVRLPGDAAPAGHELQVSTLGRALWLESAPHVVIRGLTFRCYGGVEYSEAIMVRDGSHQVWIVSNTFGNVMPGVWIKNDVDDLAVLGNTFSDVGLTEFPWYAVKAQGGMESGAIAVDNQYDGQGIVFRGNVVHDSFDGLRICGDSPMATPNNADVVGNLIVHLADDGIETDGTCSNIRILGNRFEELLCGVSVAPAVGGPTYVIRNLMVDLQNVAPDTSWATRAMKFNVGDSRPSGDIFAYHNTGATAEAGQASFTVTDDSLWTEVHLLNNIWLGTDFAFELTNAGDEPFFEDYDLFYSTGSRLVRYQGTVYDTVADYFGGTGQCEHCLTGDPLFTDLAGGDYSLTEPSPAVDQGVLIPGVNDDYQGGGPDVGALELGGEEPVLPDAGVLPDAATFPDAGPQPDGGVKDPTSDSGGCDCDSGGASGSGLALLLLLLGLIRRRSPVYSSAARRSARR